MPVDSSLPTASKCRVVTDWTDEQTAHELLEKMVHEAGIERDRLSIVEGIAEVDAGP